MVLIAPMHTYSDDFGAGFARGGDVGRHNSPVNVIHHYIALDSDAVGAVGVV